MAQQKLAKIQNKEKDVIFPITTSEGVLYESQENLPKAETVQDALDELASGIATKADIQDLEEGVDSDLDITDGENVLLRLSNGHIRTKNFNSANTTHPVLVVDSPSYPNTDLDITDNTGYNLVRFSNGHIKTKNFDSSNINVEKDFLGFEKIEDDKPLAKINQGFSMASIFKTWGFIGDSLASGETQATYNGTTYYIDNYEYSWGQRMCKLLGVEGYNYSFGGMTAKMWMEDAEIPSSDRNILIYKDGTKVCDSAIQTVDGNTVRFRTVSSLTEKDAYIIALGVNDIFSKASQYSGLGNFDAIGSGQNTVCRYYADIVKTIKEISPRAHVFIVTVPYFSGRDDSKIDNLNTQLRRLPSKAINWNLPYASTTIHVIDLAAYLDFKNNSTDSKYFLNGNTTNGHFTAAGYEYMAHVFMAYIDWIIRKNPRDFKDVALIGTSYTYYGN